MTDTQLVTASQSTVDASAAPHGSPPERVVFRLRGLPAVGRWTRLLARVPLVTAWMRPRLHVDEVCVVLAWGRWVRRVPLSTLVRISVTDRGVALGLSDSTKIELLTFGGVSCNWHARGYEFNESLCAHLHACRGRALARALKSYRIRGA